ncbi:SAF domain-containing protein [Pseudonocardia sp. ICBG1293]|uniref:SAF domain-containing protein n=1 Tax=Pseudonocardia sp. ICBG1293 TaxID=2844382 RepID=UPI001CCA5D09|nr:SAF domain-containing protein [Pseudonocardia sp. ICBG1293]
MTERTERAERPWDRLLRRPSWSRALLARRLLAAVLAVAAVVVALLPAPGAERVPVLVAARDLGPGTALGPADVLVAAWPPALAPAGALTTSAAVTGRLLAGPVTAGEPIGELRLVGPALAVAAGGPDASAVPLRPADPAVAALLSPGSRVDVVAAGPDGARVLAARAGVVAVLPPAPGAAGARADPGPLVLVALPEAEATAVAAATLAGEVTVTLR